MGLYSLISGIIKFAIFLLFAYLVLIALMFGALFKHAGTPEGREVIENNPYNHILPDGRIDPKWQKRQDEENEDVEREGGDARPPEPAMAPAAPASPDEPAPTQGEEEQQYNESDYNG
jgi:hypothetical protein